MVDLLDACRKTRLCLVPCTSVRMWLATGTRTTLANLQVGQPCLCKASLNCCSKFHVRITWTHACVHAGLLVPSHVQTQPDDRHNHTTLPPLRGPCSLLYLYIAHCVVFVPTLFCSVTCNTTSICTHPTAQDSFSFVLASGVAPRCMCSCRPGRPPASASVWPDTAVRMPPPFNNGLRDCSNQ